MAVKETAEIYECTVCGNEVIVTKAGGGTLVCCDKEMRLIEDSDGNSEDLGEDEEDESE